MLINRFLHLHNFIEHPFTKVAAEKEGLLKLYFLQPRYFSESLGAAKQAKSYVVYGPRGGGKSAIRSMIEYYCNIAEYQNDIGGKVLCITYDDFSALNLRQLTTITLSDHINEILKRGVPQLALALVEQGMVGDSLHEEYRGLLRWYVDEYMSDLSKLELDSILRMLKSKDEKIKELIKDIKNIYNTIISVLKLEKIEPSQPVDEAKHKRDSISSIHVMEVFIKLALEVGFDAVYVLIDKIDETDYTGADSKKANKLVAPMLTNMKLLELDNCAFKFFLWNEVLIHFGGELRSDRITMKPTEWTNIQLEKILEERIKAYSLGKTSLNDLLGSEVGATIKELLITLAYKSPRDINRLMEYIFSEAAEEATEDNYKISSNAIRQGIYNFSVKRSEELYSNEIVNRIIKLNRNVFTIADVASTFKITGGSDAEEVLDATATNRARNVVEKWKKSGIINQIDSVTQRNGSGKRRSVNRYEVLDPRVRFLIDL